MQFYWFCLVHVALPTLSSSWHLPPSPPPLSCPYSLSLSLYPLPACPVPSASTSICLINLGSLIFDIVVVLVVFAWLKRVGIREAKMWGVGGVAHSNYLSKLQHAWFLFNWRCQRVRPAGTKVYKNDIEGTSTTESWATWAWLGLVRAMLGCLDWLVARFHCRHWKINQYLSMFAWHYASNAVARSPHFSLHKFPWQHGNACKGSDDTGLIIGAKSMPFKRSYGSFFYQLECSTMQATMAYQHINQRS